MAPLNGSPHLEKSEHSNDAKSLVEWLAGRCSSGKDFGSMSSSIYDTAWVSMIAKPSEPGTWLFPQSFHFILNSQLPSGAWPSYASTVDGILNTAAALLAVRKHLTNGCRPDQQTVLSACSGRAEVALRRLLDDWDIAESDQVGFEILVMAHISLLEKEGIILDLPRVKELRSVRDAKLAKFSGATAHAAPSTVHHSLEGFIGHVDFDQLKQWREPNGSMMCSPASTAAYLMNASSWDEKAEAYLWEVVKEGSGKGDGSVPCAWPTTVFELSWIVATLIESGFHIDEGSALVVAEFLDTSLETQKGLIGFARGTFPDADDTAKCASVLSYLGRSPEQSLKAIVNTFEASDHFRTYAAERNPSISANINILACLLAADDPAIYATQIAKAATFICSCIFEGSVREKWHSNQLYWMMLFSKTLVLMCEKIHMHKNLREVLCQLSPELADRIPLVSLHILISTLQSQDTGGSWYHSCELTAYAVLSLSALARLPWTGQLQRLRSSIDGGKSFLVAHKSEWKYAEYLWVEKVTYSSASLSEAHFQIARSAVEAAGKAGALMRKTPTLAQVEPDIMAAAELQAAWALQVLQRRRLDIFPRTGMKEEKYLALIPLTWTACNATQGMHLSLSVLYDMMVLSLLNYQVDEYVEAVLGNAMRQDGGLAKAREMIKRVFSIHEKAEDTSMTDVDLPVVMAGPEASADPDGRFRVIEAVLSQYVAHVLNHRGVLSSPRKLRDQLRWELEQFLLAQIQHVQDNISFYAQLERNSIRLVSGLTGTPDSTGQRRLHQFDEAEYSFHKWVTGVSADDTSCPFSFVFFQCQIFSQQSSHSITHTNAKAAYLTEDLCRHLATMCRMYNDWGSLARDHDEVNLNSVNFPEFGGGKLELAKDKLMDIAQYERHLLEVALDHLQRDIGSREPKWIGALRLFVSVTDLYGQIYVLKDVGTRL
ncbi:Ent-kaurene synthase [Xylariomycetidae sp. FL2044]|nr:Ent-kaurene synthase [Xylariomycetidae sp. FL2044]